MFSEMSALSCPVNGFWTSDVEYSLSNLLIYCSKEHFICKQYRSRPLYCITMPR